MTRAIGRRILVAFNLSLLLPGSLLAQFYAHETEFLKLIYYNQDHAYLVPHVVRSFENSLRFHRRLFQYTPSEKIVVLLHDFGDYGHGGTSTVPWNFISIGIEPFDYVYETMPANERMNWLMHHELVHVVATEKAAGSDQWFRDFFGGKVAPTVENPVSMIYSFLSSPRWYSPRWYHEGIAVFLETWMAGGLGRVLGGYDEMVFRTMVLEDSYFYDVVGLESEGTTIDFQVGQNSYLYGTRFVTYLALRYGPDKIIEWFDRRPGSQRYFSTQFKKVYGRSLDEEWDRWIAAEQEWQEENLALIRKYQVTRLDPLLDRTLGSVSRGFYDRQTDRLYVAVNYPAETAHLAAIHLKTGEQKKLTGVKGPALYYVTSLAFDPEGRKLFYTTDNSRGWRDLRQLDLNTGKDREVLKDCRVGDLVVHPVDQSLWGVQHHNGLSSVVRIPPPYDAWQTLLTLEYGKDLFDLDISPDGKALTASLIEISGRQRLVQLDTDGLRSKNSSFEVLYEFRDNSPANFVFSPDGQYLYGTSYYTGVSNVWRFDIQNKIMQPVTNVETGLFRPIPVGEDRLIAFRYGSDGFVPVAFEPEPREDLNAVRYLGQQVIGRYPELSDWNAGPPSQIDLRTVTSSKGEYHPMRSLGLGSFYPVLEGYKDSLAFGMRFNFSDSVGLQMFNLTATMTPDLPDDEKAHLNFTYRNWPWTFRAGHNATDFYDLFGPTKTGRKGYFGGVSYENFLINERPRTLQYNLNVTAYGGLDTLPEYQNVVAPFEKFLTFSANLRFQEMRRTIGSVGYEKGWNWGLSSRNNVVNSDFFPRVHGEFDYGFLLPVDHSSLWLRASAGKSWGDRSQPFANFFFGGFGNNWVDHQEVRRYRQYDSFPGTEINEIGATTFGKLMAEWTLPPIRFQRLGVPAFYVNWAQLALFSSGLVPNFDSSQLRRELWNLGGQLDFRLVLFSNLESTLSLGYAVAFEEGRSSNEFMFSLKLLN